jgi:hypothetical protein
LEEALPGTADRARISGISPPQFPEPTRSRAFVLSPPFGKVPGFALQRFGV